jgi:hypothetical protein
MAASVFSRLPDAGNSSAHGVDLALHLCAELG